MRRMLGLFVEALIWPAAIVAALVAVPMPHAWLVAAGLLLLALWRFGAALLLGLLAGSLG